MNKPTQEFIQLIDRALIVAEQTDFPVNVEQLSRVISQLQHLKSQVLSQQLEPSQGVITLGLSREVADWIDSLDSPLLKAVGAIEQFYQQHWK
ncbi:MAG: hypothetical protein VKJ02_19710 [Snowella sp.]|nr:hypothetical protein [Snowella sp.]